MGSTTSPASICHHGTALGLMVMAWMLMSGNLTVWMKLSPDFRRSESSLTVEAVAPVMVSGVVVPR